MKNEFLLWRISAHMQNEFLPNISIQLCVSSSVAKNEKGRENQKKGKGEKKRRGKQAKEQ